MTDFCSFFPFGSRDEKVIRQDIEMGAYEVFFLSG